MYNITFIFKYAIYIPRFMIDSYQNSIKTCVKKIISSQNNNYQTSYIFQDTIFHLQGGGQPNDIGYIIANKIKQHCNIIGGYVDTNQYHYILANRTPLEIGQEIEMYINWSIRYQHMKIHTAGHIIDLAIQRLKLPWSNYNSYHFPNMPYVAYKGKIQLQLQKMINIIQQQSNNIIAKNIPIKIEIKQQERNEIKSKNKSNFQRIVSLEESSCGCGGTHISSTQQIQFIRIDGIKKKKSDQIRVYYQIQ